MTYIGFRGFKDLRLVVEVLELEQVIHTWRGRVSVNQRSSAGNAVVKWLNQLGINYF